MMFVDSVHTMHLIVVCWFLLFDSQSTDVLLDHLRREDEFKVVMSESEMVSCGGWLMMELP